MADPMEPTVETTPGVCYGRVSTREQADSGHGLAAQRERAEAYCKVVGIAPVEWITDRGRSGDHTRAAGRRVAELRSQGCTWRAIPAVLDAEQWPRAGGTMRPWTPRASRDALTTIQLDDQAATARTAQRNSYF